MIPLMLQLINFMNHRRSIIDCTQFSSALIVAKNKHNDRESNGVGKSTIPIAIEFALYGQVPSSTMDDVVRHGEDKCEVIFDFKLDSGDYRIHRIRSAKGKSDLKLYQKIADDWSLISGTRIPESEAKIAELIKLNHKAFSHSINFAQNDLSGLASAKNKEERIAILKEPLQLVSYTKLEALCKARASKVRKEIDKTETSMQMLGDPAAERTAAEAESHFCDATLTSKYATIVKLNSTLEEKNSLLNELKNTLNAADAEVHEKITNLGKRSKELKAAVESANEKIQSNNRSITDNTNACKTLREEQEGLRSRKETLLTKEIRDSKTVSSELERVSNDELHGTRLLAKLEVEQEQAKKSIPNGDVCTVCLNRITKEHRQECEDKANKLIEEIAVKIKSIKTQLTKCQNKKRKLQDELEHVRLSEKELEKIFHRQQSIEQELELRTKHINEAEARLFDANKHMELASIELESVGQQLLFLKEKAGQSNVPELNQQIFALIDDIRVYERSVKNVQAEIAQAQMRQGAALEKLKIAEANLITLKTLKSTLSTLKEDLKIHQLAIDACSPRGIPTFIIHTIVDELQAASRSWLNKLRPELDFQFTPDLDMLFTVNGSERKWTLLSGGQKVYIALSLKLGLSTVIQQKLGINIRFLMLDEVDQSLDQAGVEAFADVVKKLQDAFTILVITHNDNLKDKFSHAILVEGDGKNGATAHVVSTW